MRMPDPLVNNNLFFKPTISSIKRKCAHCEDEVNGMQRKERDGKNTDSKNALESYVDNLNSGACIYPVTYVIFMNPGLDMTSAR